MKLDPRVAVSLVCALLMWAASPVYTQNSPREEEVLREVEQKKRESVVTTTADPSSSSLVAQKPLISLISSEESSLVAGTFSLYSNDWLYSLKLQAPIEKGQEEVTFASLDGLANKTSATLAIEKLFLRVHPTVGAMTRVCRDYNEQNPASTIDLSQGQCELSTFLDKGDAWLQRAREALGMKPSWLVAVGTSLATEDFKFADPETLADQEQSEESTALFASVGVLTLDGTFVNLSYRQQSVWEAASASEVCRPIAGTDALNCRNLTLGGPTEKNTDQLLLEARRYFGSEGRFGGTLRLTRDLDEDVWGYQALVYILQNEDKGLNGGFDLGYRDDTDDFTLRAFIGKSFELFGQ